ncbi:MAG: MmgE/PrpD family protein [Ectothiorhodospiraceae bacterium]|nr:MmgE/PrpD family protein [Ectothiorhodospiraceae bacterium]
MAQQRPAPATVSAEGLTARLAGQAAGLRYDALPAAVRTVARQCLLDWFGVTIAGATEGTGTLLLAELEEAGGKPQASVVGHRLRTSAYQAAMINGTFSHALDYDDVHPAMIGHPSVPVAPVVLALSERDGHDGRAMLAAFVAGLETECRSGRFLTREHYERGFHSTGISGTVGAAAAASNLLGLDTDRTAVALGIAATQAAGLKSMFGTMCKPLHAGKAAANGLLAAQLARRGYTARPDALECAQGLADTHVEAPDAAAALEGFGETFLTPGVLFKYHAACYGTHASIEAMRQAVEAGLDPGRVERVEIHVPTANLRMCDIQEPSTGLEAKFSLRHTAAMALAGRDTASIDAYTAESCAEPDLVALRRRMRVVGEADLEFATSDVVVTLGDGVTHRLRGDASKPDVDLERQGRRLAEKFLALTTPVIGEARARSLLDRLQHVEDVANAGELMSLCRPEG